MVRSLFLGFALVGWAKAQAEVQGADVCADGECSASDDSTSVLQVKVEARSNQTEALNTSKATGDVHHIWLGTAYANVACGGVWDTANRQGHKTASCLGSSGGAAACVILLAKNSLSGFQQVYADYQSWGGSLFTSVPNCHSYPASTDSCWWQRKYLEIMGNQNSNAFRRVKAKGRVSMQCCTYSTCSQLEGLTFVVYNFKTPLQAAQAYAAAGNAFTGDDGSSPTHYVSEMPYGYSYCWDFDTMRVNADGIPSFMNTASNAVWYYNTWSWQLSRYCDENFAYGLCSGGVASLCGYACTQRMINFGRNDYTNGNILYKRPQWLKTDYNQMSTYWLDLSTF